MKKNKLMRLASVLLILCLLTTSVISGTFAKYVTSDSANDTARVAKFGVVATISGKLFGETYEPVGASGTGNKIISYGVNSGTVSASSSSRGNVVAPGTVGDTLTFAVTGEPEVSTKTYFGDAINAEGASAGLADSDILLAKGDYGVMVKFTGIKTNENVVGKYTLSSGTYTKVTAETAATAVSEDVYELQDEASAGTAYYPIQWSYNGGAYSAPTIKTLKASLTSDFGSTKNPNQSNAISKTLTWKWDFGTAAEGVFAAVDKEDTILGDMIASALNTGIGEGRAVVVKSGDTYATVLYKEVTVGSSTVTKAWVAYTGAEPTTVAASGETLAGNICAVLTENFNASLTVEQVD